jgi:HNH endonuclease
MPETAASWKSRRERGRFRRLYAARCTIATTAADFQVVTCGSARGHHIRHWAQGGPTTLSNLAMLCRRHHRAVHEAGYQVERDPSGELLVRRPDGRLIPRVPCAPGVPAEPVSALRAQNHLQEVALDAHTAMPLWLGERLDVGYAIDVLHPLARGGRAG